MRNRISEMPKEKGKTTARLIKTLFGFYPVMLPIVIVCILFSAVVNSFPSVFMQNIIAIVEQNWTAPDGMVWALVSFRMKDLDDLYELAANDYLNQVEARKAETERNLVDLLAALSEVEDENASLIASEGEAIAKEIIDQCDEVLGSVDATALASLIAAVYDSAE